MFSDEKEIENLIIATCNRDFYILERIQESEKFENMDIGIDIQDSDVMDLIAYIHRITAEKYIIRAENQLKRLENIKDENLIKQFKEVIYGIVPKNNFNRLEFNSTGYKVVEHYFYE